MDDYEFEAGQLVVYPAHGIGTVVGIETQDVAGQQFKVVVISFERDKMTVRLPLNKQVHTKIRRLCSKEAMAEAIEHLKTPTKMKKVVWSRRAHEYEMKINSGDPLSIAQVVRELHRTATQPEHSYSERQLYQEALDRLVREYAAVEHLEEEKAMQELEKFLEVA